MLTFKDYLAEKKSPYKPETLDRYKKKWKKGDKIPFGIEVSLKAQGMIPRADGTYIVSDEYKKEGVKPQPGVLGKAKAATEPESKKPDTHADRVEKRIHKAEKEKLKKIRKPEPITAHPDSSHKENPTKDEDFEGNLAKAKGDRAVKKMRVKPFKKKLKKFYNPKPLEPRTKRVSEGTIPAFEDFINDTAEDIEDLTIEGAIPTYKEFRSINESI